MNIDDVLNFFNMDSEDHDGLSDPLNPNAENADPSFDDASFGWFFNDEAGGQPDADSADDSQDTADEEDAAPAPPSKYLILEIKKVVRSRLNPVRGTNFYFSLLC